MDSDRDLNLGQELEVAEARIEGLLEDEREQHTITLDDLTNFEVLTLATALEEGREVFQRENAEPQARFIQSVQLQVQEQSQSLFNELKDIHGDVGAATQRPAQSGRKRRIFDYIPSFSQDGPVQLWRVGFLLLVLQAIIVSTELLALLGESLLGASLASVFNSIYFMAFSTILATCLLAIFAFVLGVSYATTSSN